jgi:hypothetical protein
LGVSFRQQAQASLHGGFLSPRATASHRLTHQPVVDFNIGPHKSSYILMCKNITLMCMKQYGPKALASLTLLA